MLFKRGNPTLGPDAKLTVLTARCPQNHLCPSIRVCPSGALTQQDFHAPTVDYAKCIRCGKCVQSCPMRALVFR